MDKEKRKCEIIEESKPHDVNATGYREEPAKYMANPHKFFWKAIDHAFRKKDQKKEK